jgi:hypothetical protein
MQYTGVEGVKVELHMHKISNVLYEKMAVADAISVWTLYHFMRRNCLSSEALCNFFPL